MNSEIYVKKASWDAFWLRQNDELNQMQERANRVAQKQAEMHTAVTLMKTLRKQLARYDDGDLEAKTLSRVIISFLSYEGNSNYECLTLKCSAIFLEIFVKISKGTFFFETFENNVFSLAVQ